MKKLKFHAGVLLMIVFPFSGYAQNSKNMNSQSIEKNGQLILQESTSESNSSYSYSCSVNESNYEEIRNIIESNFDKLQLENERFNYKIQLSKNSLKIKFNSTEVQRSQEVQNMLDKFNKIEEQISSILE